jgi:hypothetical protein
MIRGTLSRGDEAIPVEVEFGPTPWNGRFTFPVEHELLGDFWLVLEDGRKKEITIWTSRRTAIDAPEGSIGEATFCPKQT